MRWASPNAIKMSEEPTRIKPVLQHPQINNHHYHHYKLIPTPRITTYNVLSYRDSDFSNPNRSKIRQNVRAISESCDIIMIQETRMKRKKGHFYSVLKRFVPYKNPNTPDPNSGGVDILVSQEFVDSSAIRAEIIFEGSVLALHFKPKSSTSIFNETFSVYNVYLPSGSTP